MQKIDVYDSELNRVGIIWSWVSLLWTETYNDGGSFTLEVIPSAELQSLLAPDHFLRYSESEMVMVTISQQLADGQLICSGKDAGHIMSYRIIRSNQRVITDTYNEEKIMRHFIEDYVTPTMAFVLPGENQGYTEKMTYDEYLEDCYKRMDVETAIQQICNMESADFGYRLALDSTAKTLSLQLYKPSENKSAIFSTAYGNLYDLEYTLSYETYANVAYVVGGEQKEDEDGNVFIVNSEIYECGDINSTGLARREIFYEAEDEWGTYQYNIAEALRALDADYKNVDYIECKIRGDCALGEIVTVLVPEVGLTVKKRVSQKEITAEHGSFTIEYSIGDLIKEA